MGSQTQPAPFVDRRKNVRHNESPAWTWFLVVVTALLVAGFLQAHLPGAMGVKGKELYKPGDNVGYYIGLVGGLLMLIMLLYPLRKRVKFMKSFGILPSWFRWHMVLGILGPALVMFHTTFIIHSINAGVALICMMLVSGSGIFGRFFYTKIHNGLYGRQLSLKGMREEMDKTGSFDRSFMVFAPDIVNRIGKFCVRADATKGGFGEFAAIGFEAASLTKSLTKELHHVMYTQAHEKNWDTGPIKKDVDALYAEHSLHIRNSIRVARDTAQFRTYERLFSLWHIFHIPLVYMMVFSGIYHVISVHMY